VAGGSEQRDRQPPASRYSAMGLPYPAAALVLVLRNKKCAPFSSFGVLVLEFWFCAPRTIPSSSYRFEIIKIIF
jgi:hypothetical protein